MRLGHIGRKGVPELCMSSVRNFGIWPISYDYLLGGGSGHTGSHSLDASNLDTNDHILGIQGGLRNGNRNRGVQNQGGRVDLMILNNTNNTNFRNVAHDNHEIDDRGLYHGARELDTAEIEDARKDIYNILLDCIFGVKVCFIVLGYSLIYCDEDDEYTNKFSASRLLLYIIILIFHLLLSYPTFTIPLSSLPSSPLPGNQHYRHEQCPFQSRQWRHRQ